MRRANEQLPYLIDLLGSPDLSAKLRNSVARFCLLSRGSRRTSQLKIATKPKTYALGRQSSVKECPPSIPLAHPVSVSSFRIVRRQRGRDELISLGLLIALGWYRRGYCHNKASTSSPVVLKDTYLIRRPHYLAFLSSIPSLLPIYVLYKTCWNLQVSRVL